MLKIFLTVTIALAIFNSTAHASEKLQLARKMLSAFTCSIYASHAKDSDEQKRLFELGLASGRDFIAALRANEFTAEQLRSGIPFFGVALYLSGPSADFMIGRIYEKAAEEAFTDITGRGPTGIPLPPEKQTTNEKLQQSIAETKYREANCTFLK